MFRVSLIFLSFIMHKKIKQTRVHFPPEQADPYLNTSLKGQRISSCLVLLHISTKHFNHSVWTSLTFTFGSPFIE